MSMGEFERSHVICDVLRNMNKMDKEISRRQGKVRLTSYASARNWNTSKVIVN